MMSNKGLTFGLMLLCLIEGQTLGIQVDDTDRTKAREIHANCWFNAQPVRLFDPPKLVLLEFWTVRSRECRQLATRINALHEFFKDKGLLVVGLSSDECRDTEHFLRRDKITYKMGGESDSAKKYDVDQLPTLVLIDTGKQRVVGRWTAKEISVEAIAKAVQHTLGPPSGASPGGLTPEEISIMRDIATDATANIADLTEDMLATDGEIGPESLEPFKRFYEANMVDDPTREDAEARGARIARMSILGLDGDVGYAKLLASGQLSESAKAAVRDHTLNMAANDPNPGVRIMAIGALRRNLGHPGDPALLSALRGMREQEGDPLIRASLDQAIEELDLTTRSASLAKRENRPNAKRLNRMLNDSPDPAASSWAEAHAYMQTLSNRTLEQLFEDYRSFQDPVDDEIGRENATLKRYAAVNEAANRIVRGEVRELRAIKDQIAPILSKEPDERIRLSAIVSLNQLAERGGKSLRAEVIKLFEKRLAEETDRLPRAFIESCLTELKGN